MSLFSNKLTSSTWEEFNTRANNGEIIINTSRGRHDIKTGGWMGKIINTQVEYGSGIVSPPLFHPVGPLGHLECLSGQGRMGAILGVFDGSVPFCGKFYPDMSSDEQAQVNKKKLALNVARRELTQDEISNVWTELNNGDKATVGETINSLGAIPGTDVIGALLRLNNVSGPLAVFQHKHKVTGSKRGRDEEIIARLFNAFCTSSKEGYADPTDSKLTWGIRNYKEGEKTHAELVEFSRLATATIQWLSVQRIKRRDARAVYLPVFLMMMYHPELAPRFTAYIDNKYPTKKFTFEREWDYNGKIYRDPCHAGSNEYWRRYRGIVENV